MNHWSFVTAAYAVTGIAIAALVLLMGGMLVFNIALSLLGAFIDLALAGPTLAQDRSPAARTHP